MTDPTPHGEPYEGPADRLAASSGESYPYAAGYVDGSSDAEHGHPPLPGNELGDGDYARGYRQGYHEARGPFGEAC